MRNNFLLVYGFFWYLFTGRLLPELLLTNARSQQLAD
jgi:hypothetical protein